ncbi:MerR family transcriptional regulator [Litorihabitans aurantiacus]|uniref:MerR family transcriptional regulator n=1 Tax=Litorihabitans aurantiacus TaxID=1930061 RepID=A0AA38CQV6_9MICO|nr:MerR family transcriptional regulator [Litorihabitans aurantiacus]GMA32528.1 MerR family transcriptional regulator [Litorihabitans aurantiacus]
MTQDGRTVGHVAADLGVSVRTLHHWDELGVVRPSERTAGGYRTYLPADVARARRVLLLRDLGVPLADVPALLAADARVRRSELVRRREATLARIARLQEVVDAVDTLLAADERGILLSAEDTTAVFGPGWDPAWSGAARERWGDSAQWAEYAERSAGRDAQAWRAVVDATREVLADMARARTDGVGPTDARAVALAERHREAMGEFFHVTPSMHVLMARMYVAEPGWSVTFEEVQEGLTAWLRDAVEAAARARGLDPDAATWG